MAVAWQCSCVSGLRSLVAGIWPLLVRFVKYNVVGSLSAAIQLAFLYIFTDLVGIWYVVSVALAFLIAFVVSFIMQKFWTFNDRRRDVMHGQMWGFLAVQGSGLLLHVGGVWVLVEMAGAWYMLAQIITLILLPFYTFTISRLFVFAR